MFRSDMDYNIGFNYLAEAVFYTDSKLLAEGFMSTHWHNIVMTESPEAVVRKQRYAYAKYFNAAYERVGRLGDKDVFITEIEGIQRLLAALNYVNRQGLHHGLSSTPFGYPHCSANSFFRKELGKDPIDSRLLAIKEQRHRYILRNSSIPTSCRIRYDGLVLREDVIDTSYVEQVYITPRNFLFQMNKITDEKAFEKQKTEKADSPLITLDVIEKGTPGFDVSKMMQNEQGRVDSRRMTDMELCSLIDEYYVPRITDGRRGSSLYSCSLPERSFMAEEIARDMMNNQTVRNQDRRTILGRAGLAGKIVSEAQLRRCLAI